MSDINPNNYSGIEMVLVGKAAHDPEYPGYDKEGTRGVKQVTFPVGFGYKDKSSGEWKDTGTLWVRYSAKEEYLSGVTKGAKVRLDGAKIDRVYAVNDKLYAEASYGTVTVLENATGDKAPF